MKMLPADRIVVDFGGWTKSMIAIKQLQNDCKRVQEVDWEFGGFSSFWEKSISCWLFIETISEVPLNISQANSKKVTESPQVSWQILVKNK